MSDEDDDIGTVIGGAIIAVGAGYVLYRVGKSIFKYLTESGNINILEYVPDEVSPSQGRMQYSAEENYES